MLSQKTFRIVEVWQPVIGIGPHAIAWTIQRLGDLMPVTASAEVKEQELQSLADKMLQQDASAASKMCLALISFSSIPIPIPIPTTIPARIPIPILFPISTSTSISISPSVSFSSIALAISQTISLFSLSLSALSLSQLSLSLSLSSLSLSVAVSLVSLCLCLASTCFNPNSEAKASDHQPLEAGPAVKQRAHASCAAQLGASEPRAGSPSFLSPGCRPGKA